ncbi:MAG TPA: DUF433 domain-containing protein [Gemmataceae bacterium]|jgi:uncharacterized protein (DUF433 family)|nr:DUF433 domain-containing protein [Gemmataceae bacterium]
MTTLGRGVYTISDAARLTGLRPARVREWFRRRPPPSRRRPIFISDYAPLAGETAISFLDLVDVYVAGQLREYGVSMQNVRRVYNSLAADLDVKHPFCHQRLLTDGKTVLTSGLDEQGREELIEVLSRQKVFPEIIQPFLHRIDYDRIEMARRWRIADQVVVDPGLCFGKPVVEAAGMPTAILAAGYRANADDEDVVADWYNVASADVLAAVRFERSLAA